MKKLVTTAAPFFASVINDCAIHALSFDLSLVCRDLAGMGAYHEREGFWHSLTGKGLRKTMYDNDTFRDGLRWVRYPLWFGFK